MVESGRTAVDTRSAEPTASERALLVVYEGEGEAATTKVVEIPDDGRLTIGRARSANICVDSERVSRIHARISRRGQVLTIEDAGSRNGTWVNGVVIQGAHRLVSGDEIAIGPASIVVTTTTPVIAGPVIKSVRDLDERLAAEVERGHLYRRVFSLARLRFAGPAAELDEAIDRIAAAVRAMDVVAEYAPAELAIVLPELDLAAATAQLAVIVDATRAALPGVEIAVGLAAFPDHGTTADDLIARAGGDDVTPVAAGEDDAEPIVLDPQMRRIFELVRKVADHPITVLICGETGVGKEVVAAAIHRNSSRRGGPLIRINCGSIPESLLDSELFGHERGAFTGADRRKHGFFEAANGGTLFLDEIGEISAATQTRLLRVLQDHQIMRVGGTEEIAVDVRVVCATNRDLEREAARGSFRTDLYFRISAFTLLVPPLRDRRDEILALADQFLRLTAAARGRRAPQLSVAAQEVLRRYSWPGNVRELRNAIERAFVVHTGSSIEIEDLPERVRDLPITAAASVSLVGSRDVRDRLAELERDAIVAALDACGGSQTEAAKKLGMTRRALIYRMEKHGLKPPPASSRR